MRGALFRGPKTCQQPPRYTSIQAAKSDRAPERGVGPGSLIRFSGRSGQWSGGHSGQADDGIVAERGDGFQRHVSRPLNGPFVVLLEQYRTDKSRNRFLVWKYTHHLGAPLDLAVNTRSEKF